ncbi:alpha/beta hydrolase [Steroidobacter agaridevorans]|uniref:Alpha/beta hydrolase n=1 Tax=Steroidobacter agaridevorans TaxID=2695856 RepID=A0A829YEN8_9GAMM|nr:alpha/beta hydrolase [Steroidobacter agaridevorans]GFE81835.1 alpha/beta hydrolase [Steroidobacter agaridevorans]
MIRRPLLRFLAAAAFIAHVPFASAGAADTTVVLVHGAFADGSSWNKIIPKLQARGLKVISVQNPLTSLADDVAAAHRAIDNASGNVVLVGHSWGGTVITEAGNHDKVKALVYVAAFAPSRGESTADQGKNYETPPGIAKLVADPAGFLSLPAEAVATDFAQDVTREEANLIAITQGPIRGASFDEKVSAAAWETKPSWYIVASKDHMIQPAYESKTAQKIHAKVTTVPSSHVPMVSHPKEVADVIIAAATSR